VQSVVSSTQFTYTLPVSASASGLDACVRLADAPAIELDNPHMSWDVHGNLFANYGVLINDNQCPPGQTQNVGWGWGESLFVDNRVICPQGGYKVFANEGNNFTWIRPPANSSLKTVDAWPKQIESLSLRNRVTQSERLDLWTPGNGLTVSPNQIDPFGTKRAFQLTLHGSVDNQSLGSAPVDLSGLSSTSRLVIKFWAKQGTLASLWVGLYDVSKASWFGNLFPVSLGPDWKQYKFVTNQLYSLANNYVLLFYPGDFTFTAGNLYLFAPQISDDDSDYYPTGASVISDASAGSRYEKAVILTSLKTTTHTGDPSSAPSVTATGLGAGSAALQPGSTDLSASHRALTRLRRCRFGKRNADIQRSLCRLESTRRGGKPSERQIAWMDPRYVTGARQRVIAEFVRFCMGERFAALRHNHLLYRLRCHRSSVTQPGFSKRGRQE